MATYHEIDPDIMRQYVWEQNEYTEYRDGTLEVRPVKTKNLKKLKVDVPRIQHITGNSLKHMTPAEILKTGLLLVSHARKVIESHDD